MKPAVNFALILLLGAAPAFSQFSYENDLPVVAPISDSDIVRVIKNGSSAKALASEIRKITASQIKNASSVGRSWITTQSPGSTVFPMITGNSVVYLDAAEFLGAIGAGATSVSIKEIDGSPDMGFNVLEVSNGTLADMGGGVARLTTGGGGGGGGSGTVTSVAATGSTGLTVGGSPINIDGTLTFTLDPDLGSLAGASGTNEIYYRSGANVWSPVTIGANLAFSGGTLSATGGGGGGNMLGSNNLSELTSPPTARTNLGVAIVASGFNGNLATTDDTIQEVAQKFDDFVGGGGGTPPGADTQVIFNDGGTYGADADFTWNKVSNTLTLPNLLTTNLNASAFKVMDSVNQSHGYMFSVPTDITADKSFQITGGFNINLTLAGDTTPTFPSGTYTLATTANAAGFNGNLATTDDTLQEIAQKFDDFSGFTAPGADTQVLFNDGGVPGADADFVWNKVSNTLTIPSFTTITLTTTNFTVTGTTTNSGIVNFAATIAYPDTTMGALAVNTGLLGNKKSISADSTLTFSATPATGTTFGLQITNTDSAAHTITMPSSISEALGGAARTTFVLAAGQQATLRWRYDGTNYIVWGDPVRILDLTSASIATTDSIQFYDTTDGLPKRDTIANLSTLITAGFSRTGVRRTVYINAGAMIARTTNGAATGTTELATNDIMYDSFDFDSTTSEGVGFWWTPPTTYNGGTVTAKFNWTAASGSGTATWSISARAFGDDDAMDQALGTAQAVTDTLITANDMHVTSTTSALTIAGTPAANKPTYWQITRDVADTLSADARLLGVTLEYTESSTEPSAQ